MNKNDLTAYILKELNEIELDIKDGYVGFASQKIQFLRSYILRCTMEKK
jgi:hypothetical protein